MEKRELKFVLIDDWNRAVFVDKYGNYFGNVDILFKWGSSFEDVTAELSEENIQYFGRDIDGDPDGRAIKPDKIKLVKYFSDEREPSRN